MTALAADVTSGLRRTVRPGMMIRMDIQETNRRVIEQFRAGGEIDGMHREALVLLSTVGARTGLRRTTPMMFHSDGDRIIVIASNMGAPKHPDWYANLVADPHVTVEVGQDEYDAVATTLTDGDRERVWTELVRLYPFFADHQTAAAARQIPLVALSRTVPA
jgi:deazaflavin-dependent oxidoreductase (nitroreductase family)